MKKKMSIEDGLYNQAVAHEECKQTVSQIRQNRLQRFEIELPEDERTQASFASQSVDQGLAR